MELTDFLKNSFFRFCFIFGATFLLLYFGLKFITGLTVPGGMHSSFVEKYFNIAGWFRSFLINASKWVLSTLGTETIRIDDYVLRAVNGRGIRIVYACLGFAVLSFWAAYIIATKTIFTKKVFWLFGGLAIICIINILRISLVLLAGNNGWQFPFGWDHHTWFNIIAYLVIFVMMFFFEKNIKKSS
jgi:exosortase/archaeosortase family protein